MKSRFILIAILLTLLTANRMAAQEATNAAAVQPTNGPVRLDLPSFEIISQRNIFDPNRRPRTRSGPITPVKFTQVDSFTLRGTGTYDDQHVAIFVGSSSQFNKAATSADTIAGYKIAEIAFDHVKLAASSNQTINLPVGSQMKRQDNGPWSLVQNPETVPDASVSAASDKPAAAPSASSVVDDVIKRLMQKREQEK